MTPLLKSTGKAGKLLCGFVVVMCLSSGYASSSPVGAATTGGVASQASSIRRSCVGPTESLVATGVNMEPTVAYRPAVRGDLGAYRSTRPRRGDIVLFKPPSEPDTPDTASIDRVVGLPGDRISTAAGHVEINGIPLAEPWLPAGTITSGITPQRIRHGEYFVLGDNRGLSADSRIFGPIRSKAILGKVILSGCGK